eukprot:9488746-Pyramimonas_sp.AAC.2
MEVGGWFFFRSEARALQPKLQPDFMQGHRARWSRMLILGSWRDSQVACFEEAAIKVARAVAAELHKSDRLLNVADDSRGFTIFTPGAFLGPPDRQKEAPDDTQDGPKGPPNNPGAWRPLTRPMRAPDHF